MMKYRLGEGWKGDLTTGEGAGGVKYADLGIYLGDECILPLGIDRYDVILDATDEDMIKIRAKLTEMVRKLNELTWDDEVLEPVRDLRAEAEAGLVKDLGVSPVTAHRLVNSGINTVHACAGIESRDLLGMGFSAAETMEILDGMIKAGV